VDEIKILRLAVGRAAERFVAQGFCPDKDVEALDKRGWSEPAGGCDVDECEECIIEWLMREEPAAGAQEGATLNAQA
jgi:hypothetical protein